MSSRVAVLRTRPGTVVDDDGGSCAAVLSLEVVVDGNGFR